MAEFDETLQTVLGDPEAMSKIMSLAQSLSGTGGPPEDGAEQKAPQSEQAASEPAPAEVRLEPPVPRTAQHSQAEQLLRALRPYLREDRQHKLDRALQLARTTKVIRTVVAAMGKGEA